LALVVSLARYRENALDMRAVGRFLKGYEPEEGADGGQAQISSPDAGAPLLLDVLQKRTNERRIQIVKASRGHQPPGRDHPGMVGDIISERWARSSRNGGRHHPGIEGGFLLESAP
jgi:hypothetical protein